MAPPPPSDHPAFHLRLLERPFQVLQLKTDERIPEEYLTLITNASAGRFVSLTRTGEEISIVLESAEENEAATWRCIKIAGPMDFGISGVMCNFTMPLKAAGVPIFAVSTWNTDYVLVPKESAAHAVQVLAEDGWHFNEVSKK